MHALEVGSNANDSLVEASPLSPVDFEAESATIGVSRVSLPFKPIELRGDALFFAIDVSPEPKVLGTDRVWRVFRRYREFSSLRDRLGCQAPFPPKTWMVMTHERLEARRAQLEKWLQFTVDSCEATWISPLRAFLDICLRVPKTLQPGDEHFIISRLEDQSEDVRKAAVEALTTAVEANVVQPGTGAVEELIVLFEHADEHVRAAAVEALVGMVKPGSERPIEVLIKCLNDTKELVRMEVVAALAKVALPGDKLVITALIACAEDESLYVRGMVVDTLSQLAQPSDERILAVAICRLKDVHWRVRRAALENVSKMALRGSENVIEAVTPLVKDGVLEVRKAAIETLQKLAQLDDFRAINSVAACLEDEDGGQRHAALQALTRMASPDNEDAIRALSTSLDHWDRDFRLAALSAIMKVARPGNAYAINAVAHHMEDPDTSFRHSVLRALTSIAAPGDEVVIIALVSFLKSQAVRMKSPELHFDIIVNRLETANRVGINVSHKNGATLQIEEIKEGGVVAKWNRANPKRLVRVGDHIVDVNGVTGDSKKLLDQLTLAQKNWVTIARPTEWQDVRQMALQLLTQISPKGHERALAATVGCMKDQDWRVRKASVEGLAEVTLPEDSSIVEALADCLEDDSMDVRKAVVGALLKVARSGSFWSTVSSHVANDDQWDVAAATEAIKQVVQVGNELAITALATRLQHPSMCVRRAAVEGLSAVAFPGQEHAIIALVSLLEHRESFVRSAAVEPLAKLVHVEDKRALAALARCLEDKVCDVRQQVLQALPQLKKRGISCDVQMVAACLQDQDAIVRQAAASSLGQMAEKGDQSAIAAVAARLEHRSTKIQHLDAAFSEFVHDAVVGVKCIFVDMSSGDSIVATYKLDHTITNFLIALDQQVLKCNLDQILSCHSFEAFQQASGSQQCFGLNALQRLTEADRERAVLIECNRSSGAFKWWCLLESNQAAAERFTACFNFLKSYEDADEDAGVRQAAIEAFARIARDAEEYTSTVFVTSLHDLDVNVRIAALEALSKVTQPGHTRTLTAVASLLEDADTAVKQAAAQALAKMAQPGDEETVIRLAAFLKKQIAALRSAHHQFDVILDHSFTNKVGINVRSENGAFLEIENMLDDGALAAWNRANPTKIVYPGDHIIEVDGVRGDAVKMIAQLKSPQQTWATIARSTKAKYLLSSSRQAAIRALSAVALPNDERAVNAIEAHLNDQDADVKKVAGEALAMLTQPCVQQGIIAPEAHDDIMDVTPTSDVGA